MVCVFSVPCSLESRVVCLDTVSCPSSVVNPAQQQTVSLSGVARCFPHSPTLLLRNASGDQLAKLKGATIQAPRDAYNVQLNVNVRQNGNYTFEIDGQNKERVEQIQCKHMNVIVMNCLSKFINILLDPYILSPTSVSMSQAIALTAGDKSQPLTCTACSYPCVPRIRWSRQQMLETTANDTMTSNNPNCITSILTVSSAGDYKCYLCGYSDERMFVVNGEITYCNLIL